MLAALTQALGYGLLGTYGFLATPLIAEFGATRTQLGLGYSLSIFVTALCGPVIGWLPDRGPLRDHARGRRPDARVTCFPPFTCITTEPSNT